MTKQVLRFSIKKNYVLVEQDLKSLYDLISNLKNSISLLFVDFTWGAGGSTADLTYELCCYVKNNFGLNPNMHLTCTNMSMETVDLALENCKKVGIRNIVALRGDPPLGQDKWESTSNMLTCALDLVQHMRAAYGDYFCISVAGYPEGHPSTFKEVVGGLESLSSTELQRFRTEVDDLGNEKIFVCRDEDFELELQYLKRKVDAGADIIITQMFFDAEIYGIFVSQCRAIGITVPIVPGIMCILSYGGFKRMTAFCKSRVPQHVAQELDLIREDADRVLAYGVKLAEQICRRVLELGAPGLHLYTLNSGKVAIQVLDQLGYLHNHLPVPPPKETSFAAVTASTEIEESVLA